MDFLQSEEWRKFQGAAGRRTFLVGQTSIVEHELPLVGKYFYIPRGPIVSEQETWNKEQFLNLINLAKKEKAGWIRFDADNSRILDLISSYLRVVKAPHDMQPKEVLVMDISKSEEELLAEMKAKTRYNINLAEKKGVVVSRFTIHDSRFKNYLEEFLQLVELTSKRQGITSHPEEYYRKMFETIPPEIIKLYIAEYEGKVIAANSVIFYGDTAIYLHGASDNEYRNAMAPYLLQWQQIRDAKKAGLTKYDFGGIKTKISNFEFRISNQAPNPNESNFKELKHSKLIKNLKFKIKNSSDSWSGITKFKTGFSPSTQPTEFLGSYDIVINPFRYNLYRFLQKLKSFI